MKLIKIIATIILIATIVSTANAQHRIKETYPSNPTPGTILIICGGHVLYIIDADKALDSLDWHKAVLWSWDAHSIKAQLGLAESRIDHISDCKIVDNGRKALITSSYGWCAMVDFSTGASLFYSTKTPNTHSADLLPGNLIAVVNSDDTGEMWYTDMTDTADIRLWFTHEIYWLPGRCSSTVPAVTLKIPDIDVYKVKVAKWGNNAD